MKKIVVCLLLCILAVGSLCACNEYKEAQDEFADNMTSMMSEANDLKSTFDEYADGVNSALDGINGNNNAQEESPESVTE
ncbi:MAG: hypothetical protein IJ192_03315 [Clostridia bacterium]|nr:hypothetical protein [Clostridia bacterium]